MVEASDFDWFNVDVIFKYALNTSIDFKQLLEDVDDAVQSFADARALLGDRGLWRARMDQLIALGAKPAATGAVMTQLPPPVTAISDLEAEREAEREPEVEAAPKAAGQGRDRR